MKRKLTQTGLLVLIAALVCSIAFAEKLCDTATSLPAQLKDVLTKNYPDASIKEVKKEEEEIKVYEVELALKDGQEIEVTLAPDGTIMEVENEMSVANLPFDVSTILPEGAEVKEVKSEVTYAVLAPVALAQPKTTYELEVIINGKEVEFEVAADGAILSREIEDEEDDEDDEDDDDDDNDDDKDDD